jgi:hypothetical protein
VLERAVLASRNGTQSRFADEWWLARH